MTGKHVPIPYAAVLISLATALYSMYVAFDVTGNVLGNVKIIQLERYGGVAFSHIVNLELWRLFASQLIHARQVHMLYSVLCLVLLGFSLIRHTSNLNFILLWFVSGAVGTLVSTLFVSPPWNLGTGASQAVLGIASFGFVLWLRGVDSSKRFATVVLLSLIPAFTLDLIFAGYPKPGHIASVLLGMIAGVVHSNKVSTKNEA